MRAEPMNPIEAYDAIPFDARPIATPPIQPFNFISRIDVRYPLFKGLETQHAESFFRDGTLRLGTLKDYRDPQKYGNEIGDLNEGISGSGIIRREIELDVRVSSKDCFIFSTSRTYDLERFRSEFYDAAYGINSPEFFVEIAKVLHPMYNLKATTVTGVVYASAEEIADNIIDRMEQGYTHAALLPPAAIMKHPRFRYQEEVRSVFEPISDGAPALDAWEPTSLIDIKLENRTSIIRPLIIKVPHAIKYATRL